MPRPNSDPRPRDPLIGTRIDDRYTVHGTLGRGGMGVVYDGVHDELGRAVAIKVLNAAWASDPVAVARFLREARTAGSLSHGNIVDVSDLGRLPDGRPYLVMPKVHGTDLASMLRQGGPQPPKRVAELLVGVAAALDLIHAKGLVHRDIKPENLMYVVREDGSETVMLLDFGIAALVASNEPRLTRQGAIFGTPEYLPPEVWDGKVPDRRGDVYALATVAFELMTGELPFFAENVMQILPLKLRADAPSMVSVSAMSFPVEIEAIVARGLAREPKDRFDAASQLVDALRKATAQAPVSWRPGVLSTQLQMPERATVLEHEPDKSLAQSGSAHAAAALGLSDAREEELSAPTDSAVLALTARRHDVWQAASSASDTRLEAATTGEHAGSSIRVPGSSAKRWLAFVGASAAAVLLALSVWALSSSSEPAAHVARPAPQASAPQPAAQAPRPEPAPPAAAEHASPIPPTPEPLAPLRQTLPRQVASAAPVARTRPPIAKPSARLEPSAARPALQTAPAAVPPPTATQTVATPEPAPAKPSAAAPKERDPVLAAQLTREGTSALLGGQVAHATELLRRATQADPSAAVAWRSLGLALEQAGHARDAIEAYRRYLALDPHGAQADKVRERVQALKR